MSEMKRMTANLARLLGSLFFVVTAMTLQADRAWATARVSGMFSDHMVVQANQPIKIWGTADPKELVGVQLGDKKGLATTSASGHWQTSLAPLPPGGPYELKVVGGDQIIIHDVMVGEVWVCSGQANMGMTLEKAEMAAEASNAPADGSIRLINVPAKVAEQPLGKVEPDASKTVDSKWQILSQRNAQKCPALPFLFAVQLRKKIRGPIGLVIATEHGSTVQSWTSLTGLQQAKVGKGLINDLPMQFHRYIQYRDSQASKKQAKPAASAASGDAAQAASNGWKSGMEAKGLPHDPEILSWSEENDKARKHGHSSNFLPPPTSLFNGVISTIAPYSARGVLFWQGETNLADAPDYEQLFTTLIRDWRLAWGNTQMPFLFVQLPPFGPKPSALQASPQSNAGVFRDQQFKASLAPWTYMASTIDCAGEREWIDWHSADKKLIAQRLLAIALTTQYNQPCPIKGPVFESVSVEGSKLRVKFRNTNGGLRKKGPSAIGFAIAGDDKKYFWAKADIEGDTVVVWHLAVKQPTAIVYGWSDNPIGNIYNADDLPALPFKTDVKAVAR